MSAGIIEGAAIKYGQGLAGRLALKLPIARWTRTRLERGSLCFSLPLGPTLLVLPDGPGPSDRRAEDLVVHMLVSFGFRLGENLLVRRRGPKDAVTAVERQQNVICLGGPHVNSLTRDLLALHGEHFDVEHYRSPAGGGELRWKNRLYRSRQAAEFAYLAVKANPFSPKHRLVLLFGLTDAGTHGAAILYAAREYARHRGEVQRTVGTADGRLDCVLHVTPAADPREVSQVRVATLADGAALAPPADYGVPADLSRGSVTESLRKISDAVRTHDRRLGFEDIRYTMTITDSYDLRIEEEFTLLAHEKEVTVLQKPIMATVPLARIEDTLFTAKVVNGIGEVAALPAENRPTAKSFLLFPLPPVQPGDPGPRVSYSATWPRGAKPLEDDGTDAFDFMVSDKAAGPVDCVVTLCFECSGRFDVVELFDSARVERLATSRNGFGAEAPYSIRIRGAAPGASFAWRVRRHG